MEPDDLLLTCAAITFGVALYAAFATKDQLRRDWPARKVRVRDDQRSQHGPFRALENVKEKDVSAGPPWAVHLTALLGHGISPLSFFSTCSVAFVTKTTVVSAPSDPLATSAVQEPVWPWIFAVLTLIVAFALGHYQWRGSTVTLTTRYDDARRHTTIALLGRLVVDVVPISVFLWIPPASARSSDLLDFALFGAVPTLHALCAMIAVRASKGHYAAAAIALRERETNTVGQLAAS